MKTNYSTQDLVQINLQRQFGGGEVYTAFLTRALAQLNIKTTLFVHAKAHFWSELALPETTNIIPVKNAVEVGTLIAQCPNWLLSHGPVPSEIISKCQKRKLITAIAHMPVQNQGSRGYVGHDMVFPVSQWVKDGLETDKITSWNEPLYCVIDVARNNGKRQGIKRNSRYSWDYRKGRDRLLGLMEPLVKPFIYGAPYEARPGVNLGIVSRITPIKQFPLLFSYLVPILQKYPQFNLEIFGSGGYASVRDLRRMLNPIASRVRWWGEQSDMVSVYQSLDFLLSGLPEMEALGMNIVEAQYFGTPVLACNAPPFTETVMNGVGGFLYTDPRIDAGANFEMILQEILDKNFDRTYIDINSNTAHLDRFSIAAFTRRLERVVQWVDSRNFEDTAS